MQTPRKRLAKGYRRITVGGQDYLYKVGRRFLDIRKPDGSHFRCPDLTRITGLSWEEIERGKWKGWLSVTPSQVSKYIQSVAT